MQKFPFLFFFFFLRPESRERRRRATSCFASTREDKNVGRRPHLALFLALTLALISLLSLSKNLTNPNPKPYLHRRPSQIAGDLREPELHHLVYQLPLVVLYTPVPRVRDGSNYTRRTPSASRAVTAVVDQDSDAVSSSPMPRPCPLHLW